MEGPDTSLALAMLGCQLDIQTLDKDFDRTETLQKKTKEHKEEWRNQTIKTIS